MKKKYRVTTRGKIVFPLIAIILIYGMYSMVLDPLVTNEGTLSEVAEGNVDSTETQSDETQVEGITENTETVDGDNGSTSSDSDEDINSVESDNIVVADSTKVENCTTNELKEDKEALELRLIEAAGFTIYYEPNKYYVPESDLPLLSEFAAVALKFTEEQIVVEGNTNTLVGTPLDLDTENVETLGYTRALVIKNYLIKRGVSKDRIIIYNNKSDKTLNVDQSAESLALNRRVDVFFNQFSYNEINNK